MRDSQKGVVHLLLLLTVVFIAVVGIGYFAYQNGQAKKTTSVNELETNAVDTARTPSWKVYRNNKYNYSISYPSNYSLSFCENCNPPEATVSITSLNNNVKVLIEYAHQYTLCANYATPCQPTHNLNFPTQFKKYEPEEYYNNDSRLYTFKIDIYEMGINNPQITIAGSYTKIEDANILSQILSTFKFLNNPISCNWHDDCPKDSVCYNSNPAFLTSNGVEYGKKQGDKLCHRKCQSNNDCKIFTEGECVESEIFLGDVGGNEKFCNLPISN